MLSTDKQKRKRTPIATGVVDYFPDALAAVAQVSFIGNEQHNPGAPLHWDRTKSTDEADALIRHFLERGTLDTDGVRHSAKVAWRALALLQKELEDARGEGGDWTEDTPTHTSRDERSMESDMAEALRDFIGIGEKPAKECEYFLRNKGYSGTQFGRIRTRAGVKTRKTRNGWVWRLSSPPAATPESVWLSWRR